METPTPVGETLDPASRAAPWKTASAAQEPLRLNRLCALVADDDPDSRELMSLLLRWCGFDVKLAADGEEALVVAEQYRPALIFLDIRMPRGDGYEVCRRLRMSPEFADTRIVAVSGYSGELHGTRCQEAGFTAQMRKPIERAVIERLAEDPGSTPPSTQ